MASNLQKTWVALPVSVRATLLAGWSASKVGAISLAALFTIANLAFGIYGTATGHLKILELPGVIVGGVFIFVISLLFSVFITVPVSALIAMSAYPFMQTLRDAYRWVFGAVGFLTGALVWLGVWRIVPVRNLYFGSLISVFVIGGVAGCAGGLAFARQLRGEDC